MIWQQPIDLINYFSFTSQIVIVTVEDIVKMIFSHSTDVTSCFIAYGICFIFLVVPLHSINNFTEIPCLPISELIAFCISFHLCLLFSTFPQCQLEQCARVLIISSCSAVFLALPEYLHVKNASLADLWYSATYSFQPGTCIRLICCDARDIVAFRRAFFFISPYNESMDMLMEVSAAYQ